MEGSVVCYDLWGIHLNEQMLIVHSRSQHITVQQHQGLQHLDYFVLFAS